MNPSRLLLPIGLASLAGLAPAAGPTSTLYLTNYGEFSGGNVTGLDLVQGVTESSFATSNQLDICIAVAGGDVRTMGYSFNDAGSRFNLLGGPLTGGPYVNPIPNSQLHDGTSDGNFNYSVNFTTGDVLQFDRNWANQISLFNAGSLPGAGWITMNAADGSFWLSQWGGPSIVQHRSHFGTLLGSFNSGIANSAGLALDPADGTLWMSDFGNGHTLYQFTQTGTFLQSTSFSLAGSWYGMEFATSPVPEPASMAILGIGAAALLRKRRSRQG